MDYSAFDIYQVQLTTFKDYSRKITRSCAVIQKKGIQ